MVSPILPSDIEVSRENDLASFAPAQDRAHDCCMREENNNVRLAYTSLSRRGSKKDSGSPPIPHGETFHG